MKYDSCLLICSLKSIMVNGHMNSMPFASASIASPAVGRHCSEITDDECVYCS